MSERRRDPARLAQERQGRLDKRRREAMPLFATAPAVLDELAPLPTVDDLLRQKQRIEQDVRARHLRMLQRSLAGWVTWRGLVARYITPDQVRHCEAWCRRIYPPDPLYRHSYWHTLARDLGLDPSWPEPTWWAFPRRSA